MTTRMTTSEFIQKINALNTGYTYRRIKTDIKVFDGDDCVAKILSGGLIAYGDGIVLSPRELHLISEYLNTPFDERREKWVVPLGKESDGIAVAWGIFRDGFQISEADRPLWKREKNYQFNDYELGELKRLQSSAVARAIDLMKEPVPEEDQYAD